MENNNSRSFSAYAQSATEIQINSFVRGGIMKSIIIYYSPDIHHHEIINATLNAKTPTLERGYTMTAPRVVSTWKRKKPLIKLSTSEKERPKRTW